MLPQTYIIHKLNVEIVAPDEKTATKVKDDIPELLKNYIIPQLEKYLDSLDFGEDTFRMNELKIDIGDIPIGEVENEFEPRVIHAVKEVIKKIRVNSLGKKFTINYPSQFFSKNKEEINETAVEILSPEEKIIEAFLYFLETGRLPWWINQKAGSLNEESLLNILNVDSFQFRERLIRLLQENEPARERLLLQFSSPLIIKIISACMCEEMENRTQTSREEIEEEINRVFKLFRTDHIPLPIPARDLQLVFFRKIILELITVREKIIRKSRIREIFDELKTLAVIKKTSYSAPADAVKPGEVKPNESYLAEEVHTFLTGSSEPYALTAETADIADTKFLEDKEIPLKKLSKGEEDGIFVQNAGVVLLHPFLQYFFQDFDLIENNRFKNETAQTLAVHLLHYLATGKESPPEYELVFEKYLCGWNLDKPIERHIILDQHMKEESEKMLRAAISHWKQLKNTSPDGLREGFLQREGKLVFTAAYEHRLIIESKAQDVLLSYLPWGYSVIKLPWLSTPLFVEWAS